MLCIFFSTSLLCPCWIFYPWCNLNLMLLTLLSLHQLSVGYAYILMLLCFIDCMFGWLFVLLCDYCSHFFMTVLVYGQVAHMFYIIFIWSQFTCYIILVILLLALPWGSNIFCASVSGYRYICSKCITASRFRCEWVLSLFSNSHLSLESILGYFVTK